MLPVADLQKSMKSDVAMSTKEGSIKEEDEDEVEDEVEGWMEETRTFLMDLLWWLSFEIMAPASIEARRKLARWSSSCV